MLRKLRVTTLAGKLRITAFALLANFLKGEEKSILTEAWVSPEGLTADYDIDNLINEIFGEVIQSDTYDLSQEFKINFSDGKKQFVTMFLMSATTGYDAPKKIGHSQIEVVEDGRASIIADNIYGTGFHNLDSSIAG